MYYDCHCYLAFDFAFVASTGAQRFFWTWAEKRAFPESLALKCGTLRDFFVSRFESCCLVLFCIYNHLLAVLAANEHIVFTKMCELF